MYISYCCTLATVHRPHNNCEVFHISRENFQLVFAVKSLKEMLNLFAASGHIIYVNCARGYVQNITGSTINFSVVSIQLPKYSETDHESQRTLLLNKQSFLSKVEED